VAHVFVEDLDQPVLAADDFHHLARVLRLRAGEVVSVSDGRGGLLQSGWVADASPATSLVPHGPSIVDPAPAPPVTVAFALTKGQNPELTVQKLTEIGMDRIVVMHSARCVARWAPAAQGRQLQRLRQVARQAAMQSRRTYLPAVEGVVPFEALAGAEGVALTSPDGAPPELSSPTLLVGPEGGWDDAELAAVPTRVRLGPHVLRAETAAMAAGTLLVALRSGLVAANPRSAPNPGAGAPG